MKIDNIINNFFSVVAVGAVNMWKFTIYPITAGFVAAIFYTRDGAKFWEMCNLFSTFPRAVKVGEWNVKNPLNVEACSQAPCGDSPIQCYLPFVRRSQPYPNLIRYLIIKGWLSDGSPIG